MSAEELNELAEASEAAREAIKRHGAAKEACREEVRRGWVQGAKKRELQEAGQVSYRTVGNMVQGVKRSPAKGVTIDLSAVEGAARAVDQAESEKQKELSRRDRMIGALLNSKRYSVAELMEAAKVSRSTLYKAKAEAEGERQ